MKNQFFVDSEHLSSDALRKKHRLETDPASRKNHMEYLRGMEKIESDVCKNVLEQMNSFDYLKYTVNDVKAALESNTEAYEISTQDSWTLCQFPMSHQGNPGNT